MSDVITEKEIDLSTPPRRIWCALRFSLEGKTVEFEFGTLPYDHHGKPMSFLDVAENYGIFLDHAWVARAPARPAIFGSRMDRRD